MSTLIELCSSEENIEASADPVGFPECVLLAR